MKVGIMGGTFDPIHMGHLIAAERARDEAKLDEVRFMPTNVPPHKPNAPRATAEQRLDMVRLAVQGHDGLVASDEELKRGGTSFTFDTIAEILRKEPQLDIHYIIGADMVMYLPKWHRIEELCRRVTFLGLQRPGVELRLDELPPLIRSRVRLAAMPGIELSSTMIRSMLAAGRSVRFMVPDRVWTYIKENGLYESR